MGGHLGEDEIPKSVYPVNEISSEGIPAFF
jgi:hypothetical protein